MTYKRSAVTIKDIAEASGVSYPTVSYVLNNTRSVAPATRARVMEAVERLNYHPSAVARGLLKRRMNTIGVVLPYTTQFLVSDPYLGPIIEGIVQVMQCERQTAMLFTSTREHGVSTLENVPLYCDGRSDGILFIHEPTDSPLVKRMLQTNVPIVCINELSDTPHVPCVDSAQVQGAEVATRYLIKQGHRKIAFFAGGQDTLSAQQREQGYRGAMTEAKLEINPQWNLPGEYCIESGYERGHTLCRNGIAGGPTAIVCCNDLIAFGVIRALRENGVRVPEDVSVIGFDDIPAAAFFQPPLTTMRLPFREEGARAAHMLLRHIADKETEAEQELLPMTLVERQSVAPPAA